MKCMKGGDIVHQKFLKKEVTDDGAVITSLTYWLTEEEKPILEEERTMEVNEGDDPRKTLDMQWVGETYTLNGKVHSVVHMNHPNNPKGTKHSAYRDYGRFGAFFEKDIPADGELELNYRFLIIDGPLPDRAVIEKAWNEWTKKG